jgi:hypothetical protein
MPNYFYDLPRDIKELICYIAYRLYMHDLDNAHLYIDNSDVVNDIVVESDSDDEI